VSRFILVWCDIKKKGEKPNESSRIQVIRFTDNIQSIIYLLYTVLSKYWMLLVTHGIVEYITVVSEGVT
jgi:hypothetical protein